MMRRLELRPVVSRHLRVALLLVGLLSAIALAQTNLSGWMRLFAAVLLLSIFSHAWWQMTQAGQPSGQTLMLSFQPVGLELHSPDGHLTHDRCVSLSVYRWLVVMRVQSVRLESSGLQNATRLLLLLPDSLYGASGEDWRLVLIWARLMRRQISSGKPST